MVVGVLVGPSVVPGTRPHYVAMDIEYWKSIKAERAALKRVAVAARSAMALAKLHYISVEVARLMVPNEQWRELGDALDELDKEAEDGN